MTEMPKGHGLAARTVAKPGGHNVANWLRECLVWAKYWFLPSRISQHTSAYVLLVSAFECICQPARRGEQDIGHLPNMQRGALLEYSDPGGTLEKF